MIIEEFNCRKTYAGMTIGRPTELGNAFLIKTLSARGEMENNLKSYLIPPEIDFRDNCPYLPEHFCFALVKIRVEESYQALVIQWFQNEKPYCISDKIEKNLLQIPTSKFRGTEESL